MVPGGGSHEQQQVGEEGALDYRSIRAGKLDVLRSDQ